MPVSTTQGRRKGLDGHLQEQGKREGQRSPSNAPPQESAILGMGEEGGGTPSKAKTFRNSVAKPLSG